jgi:hypothetical protein
MHTNMLGSAPFFEVCDMHVVSIVSPPPPSGCLIFFAYGIVWVV